MTKILFIPVALSFLLASQVFAREQSVLARVTVYWSTGISKCDCAQATGARLRAGHCAVDPKKIPYGSKVLFPDGPCVAVDTGPAVINRQAARSAGRNSRERSALVIDRFFETKAQALAWERAHPHFMTLRVVPVGSPSKPVEPWPTNARSVAQTNAPPAIAHRENDPAVVISLPMLPILRSARRRT